jgi:hypothetical protein
MGDVNVDKDDIEHALAQVEATTKAARLRAVMPLIEAKIEQGVRIAVLLDVLREGGLELSEATLKSYLYRDRKRQRAPSAQQGSQGAVAPAAGSTNLELPPGQAVPVSLADLDRIMKPDPAAQASELARFERLGKNLRRGQPS